MGILSYRNEMKIQDGSVHLGRSNIVEGTLQIDGRDVPAIFTVDYEAGTIQRVDQAPNSSWRDPHLIEYEYNPLMKDYQQIRRERLAASIPSTEAIVANNDALNELAAHLGYTINNTEFIRLADLIADIRADVPPGTEEPYS